MPAKALFEELNSSWARKNAGVESAGEARKLKAVVANWPGASHATGALASALNQLAEVASKDSVNGATACAPAMMPPT